MSYKDGMAAINLEMPDLVPRTEYSADFHWDLVRKVTGIEVYPNSSEALRFKASQQFRKDWDYSFIWHVMINANYLDNCRTKMGHANYQADGSDFNT